MSKGRPRKQGRRDSKGKLRPIIMPDRGNERTAAKREMFGTDGGDAIGRAYRSGLLGEDGQRLMQTARSIHRAYWPMFGIGAVGCTLGDRSGGAGRDNLERERWLTKTMLRIDAMGRDHRKAFDELVLDFWPDYGPLWLDTLLPHAATMDRLRKAAKTGTQADRDSAAGALADLLHSLRTPLTQLNKARTVLEELAA